MASVREPSVAGTFYPADAAALGDQIDELLGQVDGIAGTDGAGLPTRALIAPHAGYVYSGPIAATAFSCLGGAEWVRRVVVVGPSHFVAFAGIALPEATVFRTPLGDIEIDADAVEALSGLEAVGTAAEPHRREHAIEVELPFLQRVVGDFALVPLVTGRATPDQVAAALDAVWDEHTLLVVSSDLSHFHDYETAQRLDAETADAIVSARPDVLTEGSACGRLAIQGLLQVAQRRRLDVSLLDLRNSGDTAGSRAEVVGYGAFATGDRDQAGGAAC